MIFNTNTTKFRIIHKVYKNQDKVIWMSSSTEMDNHADTYYFVENFFPIPFTSEELNLSPFLLEYIEQVNTPICTIFP